MSTPPDLQGFSEDLRGLVNRYNLDGYSHTPDFLLADLLTGFLVNYAHGLEAVRTWHGWPTLGERHAQKFSDTITHDTEGGPQVG